MKLSVANVEDVLALRKRFDFFWKTRKHSNRMRTACLMNGGVGAVQGGVGAVQGGVGAVQGGMGAVQGVGTVGGGGAVHNRK